MEQTSFSNIGPAHASIENRHGRGATIPDKGSTGFTNCERKCFLVLMSLFVFIMWCFLGVAGFAVYVYVACSWNCDW